VSDELVEVWRQGEGRWRWRYRVLDDHTELRSNRGYGSIEEAARSARQAYPGVKVVGPAALNGGQPRRPGFLRIVLISATSTFALLTLWAALPRLKRKRPRRR
jgi:hypothetical protein